MVFYQPLRIRRVSVVVFATWQSWHRLCVLSQASVPPRTFGSM